MNVNSPNLKQSILLFLLLVAIYFIMQTILYIATRALKIASPDILLIGTISSLVSFGLVFAVASAWFETKFTLYLESEPVELKITIPLALMFIGLQISISEFDNLIRYLIEPLKKWAEGLRGALTGSHPIVMFISLVIVAPITEEIFFRGILLRGMLKNHSPKVAVIASSAMFGLMHLNPVMILPATIIGIFLAWIFILTRSLWCCFFCHAVNNLVVFIAVLFNIEIAGYSDIAKAPDKVSFQPLWLDILGIILLAVGTRFTLEAAKKCRKESPADSSDSIPPTIQ